MKGQTIEVAISSSTRSAATLWFAQQLLEEAERKRA